MVMFLKIWSVWSGLPGRWVCISSSALFHCQLAHVLAPTKQQRSNKLLLLIKSLLSTWFWVSFWSSCCQFFKSFSQKRALIALYPSLFESGPPNFFERPLQNIQNLYIFELSVPGVYAFTLIYGLRLSRVVKNAWPLGPRVIFYTLSLVDMGD